MRLLKRLLGVVSVSVVLIFGCAGAASADPPVPLMPDGSVAGGFLTMEDGLSPGDCAADGTYFECYGVGGGFYTDPDTGLVNGLGDQTKQAGNEAANIIANIFMTGAQLSTAATAKFADDVYPTGEYQIDPSGQGNYKAGNWLGAFEPMWNKIAGGVEEGFTKPFVPIIAGIVLISMLVGVMRGAISGTIATFLLAFVAVGAIAVGSDYPVQASRGADKLIVETTTSLREAVTDTDDASTPGYALVGPIADKIIYERWVAGTLGSSTGPTAEKYGPIFYRAQAMSWREAREYKRDPAGAGKAIVERKNKEWTDAKEQLKNEDPNAYAYLTGERGGADRIGQAIMMNLIWLVSMPMILVSLILTAIAFLVIRVVLVFLPIIALVGVIPRFHSTLKTTAELFLAAIVNAVIFGTVATFVAVINVFIMSPDLGLAWGTQLLFAAIFTILAWTATAPFRKLTRFATNFNPTQGVTGMLGKIYGLLKTFMGLAVAGGVGGAVAGAVVNNGNQPQQTPSLQPHLAQQTYPQRATFTRPDEPPIVIDATLTPPVQYTGAPAIESTLVGESWETYLPPMAQQEALKLDAAPSRDVATVPERHMDETDGTYLVWDDGRYVMYDKSGNKIWDGKDADANV